MSALAIVQELAEAVTAAGVPATVDPRDLVLPGALIKPTVIERDRVYLGHLTVTCEVLLIATNDGIAADLATLDGLTDRQSAVIPGREIEVVSIKLDNHAADPLPAYKITTTVERT